MMHLQPLKERLIWLWTWLWLCCVVHVHVQQYSCTIATGH